MNTYERHRFPSDIVSYAVWLYYKFNLSHRDIEDLMANNIISGEQLTRMVKSLMYFSKNDEMALQQAVSLKDY